MQKPVAIFGELEDDYLQPEIVFPLTITKDRFADWLAQKFSFPFHKAAREAVKRMTPDGRFSSVVNQVYTGDLLDMQKEFPGFGYVLFEILPISDKGDKENRIEVSIGYTGKAFPQMQDILQMIATTYKEAVEPIEQYFNRFSNLPIHQIANRINLTSQALEKIKALEEKLDVLNKVESGKLFTASQLDTIVQFHLYVFPSIVREWEFKQWEQNGIIYYPIKVWQDSKAAKVDLGVYRVWGVSDGSGRCGWMPTDDNDAERERLRAFFHMKVTTPQPFNHQPNKQSDTEKKQVGENQETEPWKLSRPSKQARDKIIWEMRNKNHTWEEILDELDSKNITTGITTLKENYDRMKEIVSGTSINL